MQRDSIECISSKDFLLDSDWSQQYTNVYHSRLQQLKPFINPPESWSQSATKASRILNLQMGELSWVTGVVYRSCKNKPNVLEDVKKINHGEKPEHALKYCTPEDKIFLEDEHGRMMLTGKNLPEFQLITGLVIGVLGGQNRLGDFEVLDVCYPSTADVKSQLSPQKGKIALVSGLLLDKNANSTGSLALLSDFLAESTDIGRLVIAGNIITAPPEELMGTRVMRQQRSPESLDALDKLLASLATILPCHVMPGPLDPNSVAFPQFALPPALFNYSKSLIANNSLILESNPVQLEINGELQLLGSSGQPVEDACRYYPENADGEFEHKILENALKWRHLAPTAPDTLWSPPVNASDPLVIETIPNVLFAGNCSAFATSSVNGVRVISIPEFRNTGQLVLLDLETLETEVVELIK